MSVATEAAQRALNDSSADEEQIRLMPVNRSSDAIDQPDILDNLEWKLHARLLATIGIPFRRCIDKERVRPVRHGAWESRVPVRDSVHHMKGSAKLTPVLVGGRQESRCLAAQVHRAYQRPVCTCRRRAFGVSLGPDRTGRVMEHSSRDRAQQELAKPGVPASWHHDQRSRHACAALHDALGRGTLCQFAAQIWDLEPGRRKVIQPLLKVAADRLERIAEFRRFQMSDVKDMEYGYGSTQLLGHTSDGRPCALASF